jgi:hypothetical protein
MDILIEVKSASHRLSSSVSSANTCFKNGTVNFRLAISVAVYLIDLLSLQP